jgi:hypothetical protein
MKSESILVRVANDPPRMTVTETIVAEPMTFGARPKPGLYLMVPVQNETAADELTKRLSAPS